MQVKKSLKLMLMIAAISSCTLYHSAYAYKTANGEILDNNGNKLMIDGVAWMGFQDSNFLNELWNAPFYAFGSSHGVMDILLAPWNVPESNVASPENGVSFKSIRLPMQPGIWHNVSSVQSHPFDFNKTQVSDPESGNGPFCDWTAGSDGSGKCVKTKSAVQLLNTTLEEFNKNGVLVMLDFHHRPGLGDGFRDGTVVANDYSLSDYYHDVGNFLNGAPANVFGIDVWNEPHELYWYEDNTSRNPVQPAWIKVIAAAASATYETNPDILLFVEGPGGTAGNDPNDPISSNSNEICLPESTNIDDPSNISLVKDTSRCTNPQTPMRVTSMGSNWGENIRALIDTNQSQNGVPRFDVTKFRAQLINAIQINNFSATNPDDIADWLLGSENDGNNGHLVFAPHLYGAKVAGWQTNYNDSLIRFQWNFGFVMDSGFPFVIGEIGYHQDTGGRDFFNNSIAPYLIENDINHNIFFWTFNYIGSPHGLRASSSNLSLYDWKEQDLYNLFNAGEPPVQENGTLCVSVPVPTGYTASLLPVIKAQAGTTGYTFNLDGFDSQKCLSPVKAGTYNITGSVITNTDGLTYAPAQDYSSVVSANEQSNVSVEYVRQPTGVLTVAVSADTNCEITSDKTFVVSYNGVVNNSLQVVGTTPENATLPVGDYTISVSPDSLNSQCIAEYNKNITINAEGSTQADIHYKYTPVSACSVKTNCNTWGTPADSWAGSSCNIYVDSEDDMTKPTVLKMDIGGITGLTGSWNATTDYMNGTLTMELNNPVYTKNIGFNAKGLVQLPAQATLTTNGQTLICPVVN